MCQSPDEEFMVDGVEEISQVHVEHVRYGFAIQVGTQDPDGIMVT
jgi:hypothetical protein